MKQRSDQDSVTSFLHAEDEASAFKQTLGTKECFKNYMHKNSIAFATFSITLGQQKIDGKHLLSSGRGNEKHSKKNTTTYDGNLT
jgi:hypothetical protein